MGGALTTPGMAAALAAASVASAALGRAAALPPGAATGAVGGDNDSCSEDGSDSIPLVAVGGGGARAAAAAAAAVHGGGEHWHKRQHVEVDGIEEGGGFGATRAQLGDAAGGGPALQSPGSRPQVVPTGVATAGRSGSPTTAGGSGPGPWLWPSTRAGPSTAALAAAHSLTAMPSATPAPVVDGISPSGSIVGGTGRPTGGGAGVPAAGGGGSAGAKAGAPAAVVRSADRSSLPPPRALLVSQESLPSMHLSQESTSHFLQ